MPPTDYSHMGSPTCARGGTARISKSKGVAGPPKWTTATLRSPTHRGRRHTEGAATGVADTEGAATVVADTEGAATATADTEGACAGINPVRRALFGRGQPGSWLP